jgi:hypothetical protein
MSEINLEFLLGAMPLAEATLYRVLVQLIPAPSAESNVAASRQIKLQVIAERTGFSKRWVIELLQRLGEKNFIRTEGGSGAVQWIRLLPLGVPLLGGSEANQSSRKEATSPAPSPGKAKAPRAAARRPKHRRQETEPSLKPVVAVSVAPPVEKPAAIPARRRKGPTASIPPAGPAPDNPAMPATALIPPPPPAPADLMLPAAMMPPPPSSTAPGGPAPSNPVVAATRVPPARSRARGGAPRKPAVRAAKIAPPPSTAPGDLAAGNVMVPAAMMPPAPSAAPGGPAAGNTVVTAAKIALPPSTAPGSPAPGNPVMPAARVTPPPPTEPAAPATPAKPVYPRKSTKKIPAGRSHWESAPIEEMVAYACSLPVTPELIRNLRTPGMPKDLLLLALKRLCQQMEHDGLMPCQDRWELIGALRTIVSDL